MTLTKTKILFILLLTTVISVVSGCSMDDDDDIGSMDLPGIYDSNNNFSEILAANCIELIGVSDPASVIDSLSVDTLKVFPDDASFHNLLMQSLLASQVVVKNITRSIDASVQGRDGSKWMNYTEPYLGVYSSANDSRSKQWDLETDVIYEGVQWDYHLSILDLPEGVASSNNGERAVEIFYDSKFRNGVIIFSPPDFDAVRYPTKLFGPDIRGVFTFANDGNAITNTLYLTNIGINNNVKYIRNIYLHTELYNGCISMQAMIDFPALWFDNKENIGFTVSSIGACDINTNGTVLYSGIVPNSVSEKSVQSLVLEHAYDKVLSQYYPLWQKMIDESKPSEPDIEDNPEKTDPEDSVGDADTEDIARVCRSKDSGGGRQPETEHVKPGYFNNGVYVPSSTVTDKSPYLKALNKCLDMMDGDFPISPYKNSVNQIDWSSEKTR